ncbi:hypothetical protein SAMN05421803_11777 [Nocardiopsis flavescens]|uniref:Uncharacterized protein n=1 Tax=Nocardiopsis flavescens TaxID=758803 RepID=A0A1M6RF09_9ACTN|nr:hypothetical protein SAMN05421803_11777 [Nocardiopsis flavescens]
MPPTREITEYRVITADKDWGARASKWLSVVESDGHVVHLTNENPAGVYGVVVECNGHWYRLEASPEMSSGGHVIRAFSVETGHP